MTPAEFDEKSKHLSDMDEPSLAAARLVLIGDVSLGEASRQARTGYLSTYKTILLINPRYEHPPIAPVVG
jgi:hypothetical protein